MSYKLIKYLSILIFVLLFINTELAYSQYYMGGVGDGHAKASINDVDFTHPSSSSARVTNVSATNGDGTYKISDVITITVEFSANVTVTGIPRILLSTGEYANYTTGSGGTTLSFDYTVVLGNVSPDLAYSSRNSLELNGGTINAASGIYASVLLPVVGASNSLSDNKAIIIDGVRPFATIDLNGTQANLTNTLPIEFKVTFNENVINFDETDIDLSGTANPQDVSVTANSQQEYIVSVSNLSNTTGTVIINIANNICTDNPAGNNNTTTIITDNTVTYDGEKPTVIITLDDAQTTPTNNSTIRFKAVFSESVTGFENTDVELSGSANATTINITGSAANYVIAVTGMTQDGTVIVNIPADKVADNVGNGNVTSTNTQNLVNYNTQNPTVVITLDDAQTTPTNNSPIRFKAVFSESVTGFENTDVELSGTANAQNISITGSVANYIIEVTGMTQDGTVIVNIPADEVTDNAGNGNAASTNTQNSVTYDTEKPQIEITLYDTQATPSNNSTISFKVTFSEIVNGFGNSSVELSGSANPTTVDVMAGPLEYIVDITGMSNNGSVIINIPADEVNDDAGNQNVASTNTKNQVIYDTEKPTVVISWSENNPTSNSAIPFTITFSEEVTNFAVNDIDITNGTINNFTEQTTNTVWIGEITPVAEGIISMQILENKATDIATNNNLSSNLFEIEYFHVNNAPEINEQTFSVSEDVIDGTNIGTVIATDSDEDNIVFSIISGNNDNIFEIDTNSGDLTVINSSSINYKKITSYKLSVQVTDDNKDSKTAEALMLINVVDVEEIFEANNIFTPNSAKNKLWKIKEHEKFLDFELFIRNNTGLIVYQTKSYENNWDGKYKNKTLPTGTYYYLFSNSINGKKYTGFINLINE